jgi:DNA uptake protein ComE-like DNA-binding protein
MTQSSSAGGGQSQPESGQPAAAGPQAHTPGPQPYPPGSQSYPPGSQPYPPGSQPYPAGTQPYPPGTYPVPAGAQPAAASSAAGASGRSLLSRLAWASIPVWSIGFLAFVPFLRLAIARRRRQDWAIFTGYLIAVVLEIVAVSIGGQQGGGSTAAGGLVILLAGGGALHAFIAFGSEAPAPAIARPETADQLNREALATARGRMERRKEAREIAGRDPVLTRELRIGRPDLPRNYDDGGLVDVNQVPGGILQSGLGLSPAEAAAVVAARDKIGRFSSPDEVTTYAELPPDRLDDIRDWMIFS